MPRFLVSASALVLVSACATTAEFEPIDPGAFVVATAVDDDDYDLPVEIVERTVALPLPGQMKAIESAPQAPRLSPTQATRCGGLSATRIPDRARQRAPTFW